MLFHYLVRLSAIFISTFLFVACHSVVDPTTFHEDCMYDMCACSENIRDCLCPMIGEYAKQCAASGIEIKWRNHIPECRKFAEFQRSGLMVIKLSSMSLVLILQNRPIRACFYCIQCSDWPFFGYEYKNHT
jgi:hypothetical protein